MTPEERQLLIQTHRLTEENNKLLRKMHRSAIWGRLFHFLYWAVIIGVSVGAYYYLEPYINQLSQTYNGIKSDVGTVHNTVGQVGNLLKKIGQ